MPLLALRFFQFSIGLFSILSVSIFLSKRWGAPWVTTPRKKVRQMLALVNLQPGENLIDLGSGDGRIVVRAAKDFKAQAVGVEIDPIRVLLAKINIRMNGVRDQARIVWGNFEGFDLSDADVITLYLTRTTNDELQTRFEKELRPGTRVVSHAFPIKAWVPTMIDDTNLIFVYQIGNLTDEKAIKFV